MPASKKKRERTKPNLGFELDEELNMLINDEHTRTPWRSKSTIIRERLRQSYSANPVREAVKQG